MYESNSNTVSNSLLQADAVIQCVFYLEGEAFHYEFGGMKVYLDSL